MLGLRIERWRSYDEKNLHTKRDHRRFKFILQNPLMKSHKFCCDNALKLNVTNEVMRKK